MQASDLLGCEPEELASVPGLLLDLATSQLSRRVAVSASLLNMLGGSAHEKVRSLLDAVRRCRLSNPDGYDFTPIEQLRQARNTMIAVNKLEQAVFTLVMGRYRRGLGALGGAAVNDEPREVAEIGGVA